MAPSNVFSYLRPHHRRANSQPASPEPPLSASSQVSPTNPQHFQDLFSPTSAPQPQPLPQPPNPHRFQQFADASSSNSNSPVSPFPPVLPPIPRVASRSDPPAPQKQVPRKERRSVPPPAASVAQELGRPQFARGGGDAGAPGSGGGVQVSSPPAEQPRPSPDAVLSPDSWRDTTGKRVSAPTGFRSRGQRAAGAAAGQNGPLIDQVPSFPHAEALAPSSFSSPYMMSQSSLSSSGLSEKVPGSGKPAAPAQHGKSGKRGLNLLNPMSLLLRRRSAQALQHLSEESLVTHKNNVVPAMARGDDFDPSIRGHIVHDFSAPKPRRAVSYDPYGNNYLGVKEADTRRQPRQTDDESPSKRDRSHTPVFKENFDDSTDADDEKRKSAIRAETLANHDFLARNAPAGLPTHMTSRASRFSFQIAGVDSAAQEQLLEEKHRQKVAAKQSGSNGAHDYGDDEDDMFDYDNIDDDMFAGFEEEIPTIGGDYDDYGYGGGYNGEYGAYGNTGSAPGLGSFDFSTVNNRVPFSSTLSPISAGGESLATPRDSLGNVIGSAVTDDSQKLAPAPSPLGAPPNVLAHSQDQIEQNKQH
ncbi:hypothetical protein GTA08_BOTSDO11539 [Neofusicoccum parvum]|nr:hypothetical protein GTA08_BOTSDO11539 [Neofusicoccum parvum]